MFYLKTRYLEDVLLSARKEFLDKCVYLVSSPSGYRKSGPIIKYLGLANFGSLHKGFHAILQVRFDYPDDEIPAFLPL